MSFGEILQSIVDDCGGGIGAALMAQDGIPIEEVSASNGGDTSLEEVGLAGVEFSPVLSAVVNASDALEGGGMNELVVSFNQFSLVVRNVDSETFLIVALKPSANLGKARFLIRKNLFALRSALNN